MSTPRLGVSRIGVLVGTLIAVCSAGALVVFVARVRESADLVHCQNNLRQLGLAICNYEFSCGLLPALTDQGERAPVGRNLPSTFGLLKPYIEAHCDLYRPNEAAEYYHAHSSAQWSFSNPKWPQETMTQVGGVANGCWRVFLDPADATASNLRDVPMTLPDGTKGYYATGSYAVNGLAPWGTGDFASSFPRGMAHSILIGERHQVCQTSAGEPVYNLWGLGFYSPHMPAFAALTPADLPESFSTGQLAPIAPLPAETNPHRDTEIRFRVGLQDAEIMAAGLTSPLQCIRWQQICDPRLPGGPHRNGLQTAMADGSVRTFGWDTSPWIFWNACVVDPP